MKLIKASVCALALCLTAGPIWAATQTIYGGFEDTTPGGDHDYNDLVFSMTGNFGMSNVGGVWATKPTLNNSGTPFWNNVSSDAPGTSMNVGFCIYGGGACNGGTAIDSNALYLATPTGGNVGDVFFTAPNVGGSPIDTTIILTITADTDSLGWALLSNPSVVTPIVSGVAFNPGGAPWELVGSVAQTGGKYGSDSSAQFAFFAPAPEPSSLALLGTGLLGVAGAFRRKLFNK